MNASKLLKLLSGIHCVPILWKGTKLKIKNKKCSNSVECQLGKHSKSPQSIASQGCKILIKTVPAVCLDPDNLLVCLPLVCTIPYILVLLEYTLGDYVVPQLSS